MKRWPPSGLLEHVPEMGMTNSSTNADPEFATPPASLVSMNPLTSGADKPPGLTQLLIPANLFTGVLSCGIICLLNPWIDQFLPKDLRPSVLQMGFNLVAGLAFLLLGIKGYWDFAGPKALGILAGTVAAGCLVAAALRQRIVRRQE